MLSKFKSFGSRDGDFGLFFPLTHVYKAIFAMIWATFSLQALKPEQTCCIQANLNVSEKESPKPAAGKHLTEVTTIA